MNRGTASRAFGLLLLFFLVPLLAAASPPTREQIAAMAKLPAVYQA
jgi:hypothetical protein